MYANTANQLLRDPDQIPCDTHFREILTPGLYTIYTEIQKLLNESGISEEWRYYKDGKAWLCKVTSKKKTVVWMSLWENCFKTGFYFTGKHRSDIDLLAIDSTIKTDFRAAKPMGKLIALTLDIKKVQDLNNLKELIRYKLSVI